MHALQKANTREVKDVGEKTGRVFIGFYDISQLLENKTKGKLFLTQYIALAVIPLVDLILI